MTVGIARLNAMASLFQEASELQLHFSALPGFKDGVGDTESGTLHGMIRAGYVQRIGNGFSTIRQEGGFIGAAVCMMNY